MLNARAVMRLASAQLLLGFAFSQLAQAQSSAAPPDTVATRYQPPGDDCALFPAARLPAWLPEQKLPPRCRFTPAATQVGATEKALLAVPLLRINPGPKLRQDSAYARAIAQPLGHYHRQYFGFYNRRKQPCVFVNFISDFAFTAEEAGLRPTPPGYVPQWLRQYLFIGDGGPNQWSVYYNLATGKFYHYWHNLDLGGG